MNKGKLCFLRYLSFDFVIAHFFIISFLLEKHQLLKGEIAKVWRMPKVIVVPVVIGALGALSVNF